jgi:hypothetical protein
MEEFVHGTTAESAASIVASGVQPVSELGGFFFTFSTEEPNARLYASAFAINRAAVVDGTAADAVLVVMTVPSSLMSRLRQLYLVLPPRPIFLGKISETVFLPPSFPFLRPENGVSFRIEPVQF